MKIENFGITICFIMSPYSLCRVIITFKNHHDLCGLGDLRGELKTSGKRNNICEYMHLVGHDHMEIISCKSIRSDHREMQLCFFF